MYSDVAVVIEVDKLSKCYRVFERPQDRLAQAVRARFGSVSGSSSRSLFREFWALKEVSLEVSQGETVGIIGRNGSGKSTLLQAICGTLTPTAGTVGVDGRIAALLELGTGFNPEFTGRENVYMNASILGLSEEDIRSRFDDIVAFADIGDFIDQPVKTYSSGMYVRLAFAVIAHVDADILVVDEALSVGDVFFAQKCMRFLRDFQEDGTVLFVSHDASAITNLCDRAIWLDDGRVVMDGPAKDVCEAYHASTYGHAPVRRVGQTSPEAQAEPVAPDDDEAWQPQDHAVHRVFRFDSTQAGFGDGSAKISAIHLEDAGGQRLTHVSGGEVVSLVVEATACVRIDRPIIAANWKMHKTHLEAIQTVQKLSYLLDRKDADSVEVVICPPFTALRSVQTLIDSDRLSYRLGAQNVHPGDEGAFTGEVSGSMLAALDVSYVIVGHSERRQLFGEDDERVNDKVKAVFRHGMVPIVCVGETLEERESGGTETKVAEQIRRAFDGLDVPAAARAVVAYEPIWAIGTARVATPEQAQEAIAFVRALVEDRDKAAGQAVRILYGGSLKPDNAPEILALPDIDGALVGGASLDPGSFAEIVEAARA
jgi:lipopolysaccharide transport system ATP-binding protein